MALLEYLHREDAEGRAREVLDRMVEAHGRSPLIYEVLAHNPAIVAAREAYFSALMTEGTVPRQIKEFVYVVVSEANACEYCAVRHGALFTERFGNDPEEVAAVQDGGFGDLPEQKQAIAAFADQVARDPKRVTADHLDALRDTGYDEAGIVELLVVAASAMAANAIVDALAVSLDDAEPA